MSCTPNQAKDQILKVFKDAWDVLGHPAVYSDTANPADPGGSAPSASVWARATIRHVDGFQSSLTGPTEGKKRFTNVGTVFIQIFVSPGQGDTVAYDAAEVVASAYRNSRDIDVWFTRVRINEVGARGSFEQVNVLINFSYDSVE